MLQRGIVARVLKPPTRVSTGFCSNRVPTYPKPEVSPRLDGMPGITNKVKALNGHVVQFSHRSGFYYRELVSGTKRYVTRKIDASTIEEALSNAHKVLQEASPPEKVNRPERQSKRVVEAPSYLSPSECIEDWLKKSQQRVDIGLKNEAAHLRRCITLRKHLVGYFTLIGLSNVTSITEITFEDYPLYRRGIAKQTLKTELKEIGIFIRNYLVPRGLIETKVGLSKVLLPRVELKQEELDANPAITPNDYKTINTYIRTQWIGKATQDRSRYFRLMFHTFIHILKNTGCRPKELLALRVKDVSITNPRRWSETKKEWVDDYKATLYIYKSKTGRPRDVIVRSNGADTLLRFRQVQKGYLAEHGGRSLRPDDLVFGKPDDWMEKPYGMKYLDTNWREIINSLELEGNRFSTKPYTIYSLRSTFIENCIVDGIDIYTVATLCGNSVKIIQRYYDRHDVLKKAAEIQDIPRGATKPPAVEVIEY